MRKKETRLTTAKETRDAFKRKLNLIGQCIGVLLILVVSGATISEVRSLQAEKVELEHELKMINDQYDHLEYNYKDSIEKSSDTIELKNSEIIDLSNEITDLNKVTLKQDKEIEEYRKQQKKFIKLFDQLEKKIKELDDKLNKLKSMK